ncbi:MAG: hypothetical protein ACAH80_01215 [Alphaproteobacteria bacterium]
MTEDAAEAMVVAETVTPDKKITAAFNTNMGKWDQSHNLFYRLNTFSDAEIRNADLQMIAEFRQMRGQGLSRQRLTPEEVAFLREIKADAADEVKKHPGLTQDVAETLVFAARTVGLDRAEYVQKLIDTDGNILGLPADQVTKAGPSKFDVNSWLKVIKQHGAEHGLGYFADKIDLKEDGGPANLVVNVEDPRVLRQIVALRNNPRLSAIMGAHAIEDGKEREAAGGVQPKVWYRGVNYNNDPEVLENQRNLQALGFDIGPRADGVNGPLTLASTREFMQMYNITDKQQANDKLEQVVNEMKAVAGEYDFNGKKVPPKPPARQTKTRAGAQFNGAAAVPAVPETSVETTNTVKLSVKDAFALKLASEKSNMPFDTLLRIVIAERAFEQQAGKTSRSPGLFHINDGNWLMTVAQHGEKYGLGDIVKQMSVTKDPATGKVTQVIVNDPIIRQHILDLRKDPRVSALMGAERAKEYPIQLDIAESYLGMNEQKDNAALRGFFKKGGITHDPASTAWCGVFINSVMDSLGLPKTNGVAGARSFSNEEYGTAVITEANMAKIKTQPTAKKNQQLAELAANIKPGDIVMFRRKTEDDPTGSWSGHVAFIKRVYQEGGTWKIDYLGGNQGGGAGLGGGSAQGGAVTVAEGVSLENVLTIRRPPPIPGLTEALRLDAASTTPRATTQPAARPQTP